MAYQSWSVVFGEQPSAAKWNILGTNDAGFNDGTGIAADAITSRVIDWAATGGGDAGGIWWEEIGRDTLGSDGDSISLQSLPARKYLKIIIYINTTGGSTDCFMTFNNDTGSNYAIRFSDNGAVDTALGSQSNLSVWANVTSRIYGEFSIINIGALNKVGVGQVIEQSTVGAANTANKRETSIKWANTSAQITRVDFTNADTGSFATGSEVIILGHN